MAASLAVACRPASHAFNKTTYWSPGDGQLQNNDSSSTSEASTTDTITTAGTFSFLDVLVITNTLTTATTTITSRKNSGNAGMSVSFTHGVTGEASDTVDSDSVIATNTYDVQEAVANSGSGAVSAMALGLQFAPTSGTNKKFINNGWSSVTGVAGSTSYASITGSSALATESQAQLNCRIGGTLSNLEAYLSINTFTNGPNSTAGTRIAGGNGTVGVSYAFGVTGAVSDTIDSDTVTANSLLDSYGVNGGSNSGKIFNFSIYGYDFATTGNWLLSCQDAFSSPQAVAASATGYFVVGGTYKFGFNATQSNTQVTSNLSFVASYLGCNVVANTVNANSTATLQQGGSSSLLSASLTHNATGIFEDTVDSVIVDAADKINYVVVAGAGGTSIIADGIWVVGTTPAFSHRGTDGVQSTVAVGSQALALSGNIFAGDLVVVRITGSVAAGGAPTYSVSDGTNTYVSAVREAANTTEATEIYYCINAAAVSSPTVTITPSASATLSFSVSRYQIYSGYTITLDGTSTGSGAALSTTWTTGACSVTGTLDLVCSIIGILGAPSSVATTTAGYRDRYNAVAAGGDGIDSADLLTSSNSTPSGTIGGAGLANASAVVAFKATPVTSSSSSSSVSSSSSSLFASGSPSPSVSQGVSPSVSASSSPSASVSVSQSGSPAPPSSLSVSPSSSVSSAISSVAASLSPSPSSSVAPSPSSSLSPSASVSVSPSAIRSSSSPVASSIASASPSVSVGPSLPSSLSSPSPSASPGVPSVSQSVSPSPSPSKSSPLASSIAASSISISVSPSLPSSLSTSTSASAVASMSPAVSLVSSSPSVGVSASVSVSASSKVSQSVSPSPPSSLVPSPSPSASPSVSSGSPSPSVVSISPSPLASSSLVVSSSSGVMSVSPSSSPARSASPSASAGPSFSVSPGIVSSSAFVSPQPSVSASSVSASSAFGLSSSSPKPLIGVIILDTMYFQQTIADELRFCATIYDTLKFP